jgi:hypothetical protein
VAAREDLVGARRDELYFRLYPHESAAFDPPTVSLVGGIPARLRSAVPGLSVPLGLRELRRLLEADAEFVATMRTPAQAEELRDRDDVRHGETGTARSGRHEGAGQVTLGAWRGPLSCSTRSAFP